ncbi:adenylate/guanylate cyclase domain-containing protein [Nocardioides marmoribigeumensis]|uniref:Adenylate cyclase n=1 Tax=Nocardioides marmoribigeumensis TaxID=433649 RepID=A0ABU2C004_9ACTN|nr:adenylate/guanylate cyclase domain-containing protein [Nocardioides marmoribigeumensis]MDR7363992.1 adenylate cyclase [Nocardioides marmoribigeumensis]
MTTGPDAASGACPDRRRYTATELAEASGLAVEDVRAFWWVLGLPDAGDHPAWTEDDLHALRALTETGLGREAVTRVVRAVGQSVARMAEWQVAAVASTATASGKDPDAAADALEQARPALERVVAHAWRRHLEVGIARLRTDAAVAAGHDSPPAGVEGPWVDEQTHDLTVGFADLVNFSGLSSTLDVGRIGDLVEVFEARCADVVTSRGGRLIKTIGDAVLFVADDADDAARIAFALVEVIGRDARLPDVRLGLASGPTVNRLGDVFGSPVNLASRLTALARRNRVLVDDETLARLPKGEYVARRLSARPVRGFGLVEPVALAPA